MHDDFVFLIVLILWNDEKFIKRKRSKTNWVFGLVYQLNMNNLVWLKLTRQTSDILTSRCIIGQFWQWWRLLVFSPLGCVQYLLWWSPVFVCLPPCICEDQLVFSAMLILICIYIYKSRYFSIFDLIPNVCHGF